MVRRLQYAVACALLIAAELCKAEHEEEFFIDKFVVQYAGMLGMISMGVENTAGKHSDYQLLAGYTPASEAGVDVYTLGIRANYVFDPFIHNELGSARFYTGIGLYYYFGEQYQSYDYPAGYYTPPAAEWHVMPYLGIRLSDRAPSHNGITLYTEVGIIDFYLHHYYNNSQTIRLSDAISLAIGASIPLR